MEDTDDDAALMTEYGAIKIQSLVRMLIVRSKLLKKINARYEKIYDPKRERFYYYDKVLDQSSWGKPPLLLNSDIAEISPLFVEDDENKEQLQMTEEDRDGEEEVLGSVLDENLEKSDAEESSSDESSVDSATARERRRAKRRYPRSKAQGRVDQGEDNIQDTKALDLSGLAAHRISSRIYDLSGLTYLNISDNQLTRISPNIQYFVNLQQLDVNRNLLPTLPKELEELQRLTYLDVSRNNITTFPGRVYKLRNLEHLNLSRNPLKALPIEVGNLELLQELGQWEVGISFLSRLQHLDVSRCLLTGWPPQIHLLPELTHLDLSHNEITVIPAELGELLGLQTLLLSHNGVEELTADIYTLPRLQVLDLSHNRLAALPRLPPSNLSSDPGERCMECLVDLDLSHNTLTVLDEMLSIFTRLETCNASHNKIDRFEGDPLAKLTALRVLDVSHNELPVLSPGLRFCASLQHLRAAHNKLSAVPEALARTTRLVSIDLSHNEITDAAGKIFAMLNDLRKVDLHHNRIASLPSLLFSLRHLQHLDCSYNELVEIPEAVGTLTGVTYLNFANNQIVTVPESISNLMSLKGFELASNCITALPSSISKLYRTLAKVTISRNNLTVSPNLLVTLPMLLSCNLSWNPNLKAHFVDWAKLSVDYKPKKAFISPEILTRRISTVVDRLDVLIAEAKPPASPESYYMSGEQAAATAGAEPVDEELLEFQAAVEDGSNPEQAARSTAARKDAKKRLAKSAKKVKQAMAWQMLLREHIMSFARREESSQFTARSHAENQEPSGTSSAPAVQPMPVIGDVAEAQKARLAAHMHSLFKHLDKNRGGAPIGMSWQEALLCTEVDLFEDSACGPLLLSGSMSLGAEFQDSIESLQYLINEVDALMMLQELRYRLDHYARLMGRLQAQQKEEKAFAAVSSNVKSRMTVLGGVAKRFVKTANAGGNLAGREEHHDHDHQDSDFSGTTVRSSTLGLSVPASHSLAGRDRSEDPGWLSKETSTIHADERSRMSAAHADFSLDADVRSVHEEEELLGSRSPDRASTALPRSPDQNAEEDDENDEASFGVPRTELPHLSMDRKGNVPTHDEQVGFEASVKVGGNRKETAEDQLDLLTRNIRVSVKVRRDNQKLVEEAAKLARSIADTLDQVQKPSLGIVYTRLPHLAFLPVAVEGILPGSDSSAGMSAQNEALLPILVDCCLQLCKTLLLRADSLRDAIRELEIRGSISVSSLDVSQRRGEDFMDLMEDVLEDLSRAIDLKENESGAAGGGPKRSKSIFGKKNSTSSSSALLLEAAMAGPPSAEGNGDGSDAEGAEEEDAAKLEGDDAASAEKSEVTGAMTRQGSSATVLSATSAAAGQQKLTAEIPVASLSSILPRPDPGRVVKHPAATGAARRCIKLLSGHRTLTLMWTSYLLEAIAGMLARRGTDPQYQKFRAHTRNSYNPTPEWVTQVTGRLAQMKGRVFQGLCIYHRAIDEFAVCTKFSKNARSRPYYVSILKVHLAQGNFMWARSVLHDALRGLYPKSFPGFDLNDPTAMPDPIDVLRVDKELALLQALVDVNMAQLNSCGLFTSTHSRFCSVQENGLLSAPERVPIENARGLTLHAIAAIKEKQNINGIEAANKIEREARESSREELKQLIREAREKTLHSLSIPQ